MLLAGKVMLKRCARLSIGVKRMQPHAVLMLFRQTATVVQPLQSQVVTFANGWDISVWRLQQQKTMCNNAVNMRSDLTPRIIAVSITALAEFSKNNVMGVPVQATCSM